MALLKIFKPKWEHPDEKVRLKAVRKIDCSEQKLLAQILSREEIIEIQQEVLQKISDVQLLEDTLLHSKKLPLMTFIAERLDTLYAAMILSEIDLGQKIEIFEKISHETTFAHIAISAPETKIRLLAVEKISDQTILLHILSNPCGKEPAVAALKKITDPALLEEAAQKANSRSARAIARDKLLELRGPTPQQLKKIRDKEITSLLEEAKMLTHLADPESAHEKFSALSERWHQYSIDGSDPLALHFSAASKSIENRLLNFIKHKKNEEQKKELFISQFSELIEICTNLCDLTDQTENSFPELFNEIIARWEKQYKAFNEPERVPEELVHDFHCLRKVNQKKSKKIIAERELKAEIESLCNKITLCFQNERYSDVPSLLEECRKGIHQNKFLFLKMDELASKFESLASRFNEHQTHQKEEREKLLQENLASRQSLLQELIDMANAEDIPQAEKRFAEIDNLWAENIELQGGSSEIDQSFHEAASRFKDVRENFFLQKDWQLWTNKNLKEGLIAEMQALNTVHDLHLVFKELKNIQEKWNTIGDVPLKEANKLWRQFSKASDFNFKRCQNFFTELDALADENEQKKLSLILQAEEHQDSSQWNKSAAALIDLQKEWNGLGRAKKEKEEELFLKFRETCSLFFSRRKEHYKGLAAERQANLHKKETFCLEVEEIINNPDVENTKRIQELQKEWKEIGPVPKEQHDKIWSRFRQACNKYYEWLDTLRPDNLLQKESLCEKATELTLEVDFRNSNFEKISRELIELQKQWKTIGPAPKSKENEVWKKFRKICDLFFTKKKNYYDELDRQRPLNEETKKEYIKQVQLLIENNSKNNVKKIIQIQQEWKGVGPATKKNDHTLEKQFKEHCDTFFNARRDTFEELDRIRRENLKKKEELCVRLELLAGIGQEKGPRPTTNNALTLAEQLKLAFESNFVLSGEERKSSKRKNQEMALIQKEWDGVLGEVPKEHEYAIQRRYKRALKAFQDQESSQSAKKK